MPETVKATPGQGQGNYQGQGKGDFQGQGNSRERRMEREQDNLSPSIREKTVRNDPLEPEVSYKPLCLSLINSVTEAPLSPRLLKCSHGKWFRLGG